MKRLRLSCAVLLAVFLAGCFEDPVEETVRLEMGPRGTVEVIAVTRLSALHLDADHPRLERRLRQTERMLEEGWDDWPRRFDAARPAEETVTFRRQEGRLLEVERRAVLTDPAAVNRFFGDRLTAVYAPAPDGRGGEIAFYPASGTAATGGERQHVERALEAFSGDVAAYLAALAVLHAWLDEHPDQARAAFGFLFRDFLSSEEADAAEAALSGTARERVQRVDDAMQAIVAIFQVPPEDAFTLNELARKVYDPFPGRLVVEVPDEVLEVEGFVEREGAWVVPGLDLWGAFAALADRWIAPDPLVAYVETGRDLGALDLDAWLARERRTGTPPDSVAVRRTLDHALSPAPVYRLAWRRVED